VSSRPFPKNQSLLLRAVTHSVGCDRSPVIAKAVLAMVLQHIVTHWNDDISIADLHEQITEYLRDEISDAVRQTAGERSLAD
jgi:hypothetical protein